ncbi:hypothetical protein [Polaromonas sp.]|jgi:hypothetical protein|uniref:hypothetical protein n=1 Tax=Polaromonas sp. TaxID=1869339 RepID=UPI003563B78B
MATAKNPPTSRKQAGSAAKKVPLKKTTAPAAPARPIIRKAAKPAAKPAAPKAEKPAKAKKPKLVRDSFTIPKAEYLVLDQLKQRAGTLTRPVKKSELLRAGIKALAAMPDAAFLTALANVPAIKTGRPAA